MPTAIALMLFFECCAPKVVKTVTNSGYSEDLSIHREQYNSADGDVQNTMQPNELTKPISQVEPKKHIRAELDSVNKIILANSKGIEYIDGYTIQLYSGNNKQKSIDIKRKIYEIEQDYNPRLTYEQPNYKVQVGKYLNRLEANSDLTFLKKKFNRAVLIPTRIKIDQL